MELSTSIFIFASTSPSNIPRMHLPEHLLKHIKSIIALTIDYFQNRRRSCSENRFFCRVSFFRSFSSPFRSSSTHTHTLFCLCRQQIRQFISDQYYLMRKRRKRIVNERVKQFFDRISGNNEREKEIKNLTHDRNIDTMRTQSAEKNVSITGMPNGTLFTPHERQRESTHSRAHPLIL